MIRIGDPRKMDARGLLTLEDNPVVVFPGYRMKELPPHLADQMVKFVDDYRKPILAWELEPDTERRLARIVKCGIRSSDDSGLTWDVLVDHPTGEVLVAGNHFHVWTDRKKAGL